MGSRREGRSEIVIGGARGIGEGVLNNHVRDGGSVRLADLSIYLANIVVARHDGNVTTFKADITNLSDKEGFCGGEILAKRYDRVILTGSIVSWPQHSAYAASKSGIVGPAKTAIEVATCSTVVNVLEPGNVDIENTRFERGMGQVELMTKAVSMDRLPTHIYNYGEAVDFFASNAASCVTSISLAPEGVGAA